jgi:cytochrome P450
MSLLDHLREVLSEYGQRLEAAADELEAELLADIRTGLSAVDHHVDAFLSSIKQYAAEHPAAVFAILRRLQPILVRDGLVLVTRFDDVIEVLARDDVFDVPYAEKMRLITDGEGFFLGMADSPRYERDHTNMRMVVRRDDIASRIAPFVAAQAETSVGAAGRPFDAARDLCWPVPARFVGDYFGLPGPDERQMVEWSSTLFWFLFLDPDKDAALRDRALAASAGLNAYIDAAIAERKRLGIRRDDVLGRCLSLQATGAPGLRDLDVRNDLVGLIIGAIPTTASVSALALDELLRRPEQLAQARAAAKRDDDALLGRVVFEALRFNPFAPGIFRVANRSFVLAAGTHRETAVGRGATVVAATQSAMLDSLHLEEPDEFRLDRSPRDELHFGHGLHTCFGQHINRSQIPGLLKPLLRRENLRRAEGEAGKLLKAGPYPASLNVLFD